jgi:uncharacterized protein YrrD
MAVHAVYVSKKAACTVSTTRKRSATHTQIHVARSQAPQTTAQHVRSFARVGDHPSHPVHLSQSPYQCLANQHCYTLNEYDNTVMNDTARKMANSVLIIAHLVILCLVKPVTGADGVTVTESSDYTALAKNILNPDVTGVTINDVQFTGDASQIGTYSATGSLFDGLPRSGVVMSSGRVIDEKEGFSFAFGGAGDVDLDLALNGFGATVDAAVLVVDVTVPKAVDIDIAFVVGSNEYLSRPGKRGHDIFGLFHGDDNVAHIGQNGGPVHVWNVNCDTDPPFITPRNCGELIDNPHKVGTTFRAYTKRQVATLRLPGGRNQVKIAIADARGVDGPLAIVDTAVFLSFLDFRPNLAPTKSPTQSADYLPLAKTIFRPDVTGVTINSAVFTGDPQQIGTYSANATGVTINGVASTGDATGTFFDGLPRSGVVLSSGKVVDLQEPSIHHPIFPDLTSSDMAGSGDVDLTKELLNLGFNPKTKDAAVLVVDVTVPQAVDIDIAFVFGSMEYWADPESLSPDAFGLFRGGANIALIGEYPVSVLTVNCQRRTIGFENCNQFIWNQQQLGTSLYGYTKTQIATLKLPVGANQKVKIAIADANHHDLDSGVFLSFLSFQLTPPTLSPTVATGGVTGTQSADYMALAKNILRPDVTGVTINDVKFTGNAAQIGTYSATGTFFGGLPRSGVVLSSGNVVDVNDVRSSSSFDGPGYDDLSKVLQGIGLTGSATSTYDAAVLVVDVTVSKAVDIGIAYVFGSTEYKYTLDSQSADVFGFFQGDTNIALIGNRPVSIATVNCGYTRPRNCEQFIANQSPNGFSGYTKSQIATLKLPAGANQKVTVAIADSWGFDDDTAVFLSFMSLTPSRSPTRKPTLKPTRSPTMKPTRSPTRMPTQKPTQSPTSKPTMKPTQSPTMEPTGKPTRSPTSKPTRKPNMMRKPTMKPTPTGKPTMIPTSKPTRKPNMKGKPTTMKPTQSPTSKPTMKPTRKRTME